MIFAKSAFSNKAEKVLVFQQFWRVKSIENHYKLASKNTINKFVGFLSNFNDFLSILASQIPPKITKKSILGGSGVDLAWIWCCKVESGWILAGLGSIFRGFGWDFRSNFWMGRAWFWRTIVEWTIWINCCTQHQSFAFTGMFLPPIWCGGLRIAPGIT